MKKKQVDIDWENRRLCIDGNCIGVIGPDGRCKECGKPYEGELPEEITKTQTGLDEDTVSKEDSDKFKKDEVNDEEKTSVNIDWENRTLCSDGNCIGVIGPDGRCKECGKLLESG